MFSTQYLTCWLQNAFLTVYIIRNESMLPEKPQSLVKDDSTTGRFDKCIIFSRFTSKLFLAINEVCMIFKAV